MGEAAIRSVVVGFLTPEFFDEATGIVAFSNKADFEKVRLGYACANGACLAEFSTYTVTCPICGHKRDVAEDLRTAPQVWQEYFDERNKPAHKTRTASAQDALSHLAVSPDVERIPLSRMKPPKWGRGK